MSHHQLRCNAFHSEFSKLKLRLMEVLHLFEGGTGGRGEEGGW